MRKIIAGFATTIDGFIEGPDGEIDWIIYDQEQFKELGESWKKIDAMFYGRKTYEASLKIKGELTEEIDNPFVHMKHYVFSRTLDKVEDNYILVNGDLKTEVEKIRNVPGGEIAVFGGAELVSSLLNLNLIDELTLPFVRFYLVKGKLFFLMLKKELTGK